ncbi:unnamed protein product, partial [Didymodactylos carnosus]
SSQGQLESEKNESRFNESERGRNLERRCGILQCENEMLQQNLKTMKTQLRDLQEVCATRETQHKQEIEKTRIDMQSPEVQQYLKQEIQRCEDILRTESAHQQEKMQSLAVEYRKLEDEFRLALKIEEKRYEDLHNTNEVLRKENDVLQNALKSSKQREESDRKIENDLMALVREQKERLQERTEVNDVVIQQNKHLTTKFENA